jgi:hypothetical protein
MRIAYQGEPGAFSEAAARLVEPDADLTSCRTFEDVFDTTEAELVRQQHEGADPEDEAPSGRKEINRPLVADPVLARALDLLKGLAVIQQVTAGLKAP